MKTATLKIRVPATSANLGPGFDTLGMALQMYNRFEAVPSDTFTITLAPGTCVETSGLSLDPQENLFAKAYRAYFQLRESAMIPVTLSIEAHIPLARGLGSSSSAIVAGLFLANAMHPEPVEKVALLPWAATLEGHPDNVAPALLGGVQCCFSNKRTIPLTWPESWKILLVIPPDPLSTEKARHVLPLSYPREDAVENMRALAAWLYALQQQDEALFRYALESDRLHQPARSNLIPEFQQVKSLLASTEILGSVISGAGSTIAVFSPSTEIHTEAKTLLQDLEGPLSHCRIITVKPDHQGTCPEQ